MLCREQLQEAQYQASKANLVECRYCSRRFAADRVGVHERVCQRTNIKLRPRSPEDATTRQRRNHSPAAFDVRMLPQFNTVSQYRRDESVCLSVRSHISKTTLPNSSVLCMFPCRFSVLVRRCCSTLCTSGFVYDAFHVTCMVPVAACCYRTNVVHGPRAHAHPCCMMTTAGTKTRRVLQARVADVE